MVDGPTRMRSKNAPPLSDGVVTVGETVLAAPAGPPEARLAAGPPPVGGVAPGVVELVEGGVT